MKNLLNKKARIDFGLTSDPKNKQGQIGTIIKVVEFDEENADISIKFDDGEIGVYQQGTFEII